MCTVHSAGKSSSMAARVCQVRVSSGACPGHGNARYRAWFTVASFHGSTAERQCSQRGSAWQKTCGKSTLVGWRLVAAESPPQAKRRPPQPKPPPRSRDLQLERAQSVHRRTRLPALTQLSRVSSEQYRVQPGTPRYMPSDFDLAGLDVSNYSHLRLCTSCALPPAPAESEAVSVGQEPQLFLDDFVIAMHQDVARVHARPVKQTLHQLLPPRNASAVKGLSSADHEEMERLRAGQVRFPAHVERAKGGGFRMWLQGAHHCAHPCQASYTTVRHSEDGLDWGAPDAYTPISLDGRVVGGASWIQLSVSRPSTCAGTRTHRHAYYASFWCGHTTRQAMRAYNWRWPDLVCLAASDDGISWHSIGGGHKHPILKLGHGADCDVSILFDCAAGVYALIKRRNIPSPLSWRHIRGTEVFWNADIHDSEGWARQTSFWLDRDSENDRYRRQVYSLTATPFSSTLNVGVLTCLEYPKVAGKDLLSVYLSPSRNALEHSVDDVYSSEPFIPLGDAGRGPNAQGAADASAKHPDTRMMFPANSIVTHDGMHWLYYEGR